MTTNTVRALADAVLQIEGFEYLSAKFQRITDIVNDKVSAAAAADLADFNVIIHGDMWSNNIMFGHDTQGNVQEAIFVDYQMCTVGSPVLDLVYVLYTSSAETLGEEDWNDLITLYWTTLTDTLQRLQFSARPIPTLNQLQQDRRERTNYAMYSALFTLAVRNLEVVDVVDDALAKMMDEGAECHQFRVRMLLNPKIQKALAYLLNFFDRNGLFD